MGKKPERQVYGYSSSENIGGQSVHLRFVGYMFKTHFIERVNDMLDGGGKNWIRERVCRTGNEREVELAMKYEGHIVVLHSRLRTVLAVGKLPSKLPKGFRD